VPGKWNRPLGRLAPVAVLAALLVGGSAVADGAPPAPLPLTGDEHRGATLAATCSGCHAIPGYRNAYPSYRVPKLGGQNADYIEVALQHYRAGARRHPTMHAQAWALTDQDIADLAAYFSRQAEGDRGISDAGAAEVAAGQIKATACAACHGEAGVAAAPLWPNLAGQHRSYLEHALLQYRTGVRADPVMGPLIAPLSDEDIRHLAAYFASQAGLYTPAP
jgi:cytochrome c553